jgi:hypothetical protein
MAVCLQHSRIIVNRTKDPVAILQDLRNWTTQCSAGVSARDPNGTTGEDARFTMEPRIYFPRITSTPNRSGFIFHGLGMVACLLRFHWLKIAGLSALSLLAASCAARKAPAPLPVYPSIPESAVRQLRYLPSVLYDRLETITIEAEAGAQYISAFQNARQAAAREGGNTMILVEDAEFRKRINGRQSLVRRTIYWVVHLK